MPPARRGLRIMSTEKRYQVFISSTFKDLQEERQAVLRSVLQLGHIPAGMELFAAGNTSTWDLIQKVIDSTDYYVVIVGGRYGSVDDKGKGYTEREYDYARARNKYIIPFLHKAPDSLQMERSGASQKRLRAFREKLQKDHSPGHWGSSADLRELVSGGLLTSIQEHPAMGWVRANDTDLQSALALQRRIEQLEKELAEAKREPPAGIDNLAQGDDVLELEFSFWVRNRVLGPRARHTSTIGLTWNAIFGLIAPGLFSEAAEHQIKKKLEAHLVKSARAQETVALQRKLQHGDSLVNFDFGGYYFETCIIQLRELGLMKPSVEDGKAKPTYWTLTPYGDRVMVQLRVQRKSL